MRTCAICGEPIPETRRKSAKYCSLKCLRISEKNNRIEYIAMRSGRRQKIAYDVYAAYKHKCALCGWQVTPELLKLKGKWQYAHGNEIHHIIPVQEGGTDNWDNVILLCPNHHKAADLGLIDQETLREHTRPLERTEAERDEAKSKCAAAVAAAIFGEE